MKGRFLTINHLDPFRPACTLRHGLRHARYGQRKGDIENWVAKRLGRRRGVNAHRSMADSEIGEVGAVEEFETADQGVQLDLEDNHPQ